MVPNLTNNNFHTLEIVGCNSNIIAINYANLCKYPLFLVIWSWKSRQQMKKNNSTFVEGLYGIEAVLKPLFGLIILWRCKSSQIYMDIKWR